MLKLKVKLISVGTGSVESVSILEFRRQAEAIIQKVRSGKRMILTYRGKPVIRMEPILEKTISIDDPFYKIDRLAAREGNSISNEEIDQIVYGK
jgi:antitoxin (DNA-binding transcriptional repressor) of toxin-antitoxin stability system